MEVPRDARARTHKLKNNKGIIIYIPNGHSDRRDREKSHHLIIRHGRKEGNMSNYEPPRMVFLTNATKTNKKNNNNTVGGGAFVDYTFCSVLIHHHKRESLTWLSDTNRHTSSCLPSTSLLLLLLLVFVFSRCVHRGNSFALVLPGESTFSLHLFF